MNPALIEILVLAGIAIFLILRLKNVLGTRDGFEKTPVNKTSDTPQRDFRVIEGGEDTDITDNVDKESKEASELALMKRADPSFSVNEFLGGARAAYEMILMAFENGDLSNVKSFLDDDVVEVFQSVIDARSEQNLTVEAEFYGVRELKLKHVEFDEQTKVADITVNFVGELSTVVKDINGNVVEGDAKKMKRQKDTWTFSRDLSSGDPNWMLVATGE